MAQDENNAGVQLAQELGVDLTALNHHLRESTEYPAVDQELVHITLNEAKLLLACLEVACGF